MLDPCWRFDNGMILGRSLDSKICLLTCLLLYLSNWSLMGLEDEESTVDTTPPVPLTALQGTWNSSCTSGSPYQTETLQVVGFDLTLDSITFDDSSCSSARYSVRRNYSNLVGGSSPLILPNGSVGYTMNSRLKEFSVTPLTSEARETMNNTIYCGISSWQDNQSSNVAGRNCGSGTNPVLDTSVTDMYSLVGSSLYIDSSKKSYQKNP